MYDSALTFHYSAIKPKITIKYIAARTKLIFHYSAIKPIFSILSVLEETTLTFHYSAIKLHLNQFPQENKAD